MAQAHAKLFSFFKEQDILIDAGTPEFFDFALEQLMSDANRALVECKDYEFIRIYLAYYVYTVQNNIPITYLDKPLEENPVYEETNEFLTTNVKQINAEMAALHSAVTIARESKQFISTRSYSATNAISYARSYALFPYNTLNYPYFISGDCTNFVSQCVYAGGMSKSLPGTLPDEPYPIIIEDTNYWAYYSTVYTTSWVRVSDFYTYWAAHLGSVTNYSTKAALKAQASAGDVVQLVSSGIPYHTIILSQNNGSGTTFCAHTTERKDADFDDSSIISSSNTFILFDFT
jgi:hypothetical protein